MYTPPAAPTGQSSDVMGGVIMLLIGAGCFFELRLIGTVSLTELLLLVAGVYAFRDGRVLFAAPLARRVVFLGMLWLGGQVATDMFRGTAFNDFARGWVRIVFILAHFSVIYLLIRERVQRVGWFAAGLMLGMLIAAALKARYLPPGALWKFSLAVPCLYLCGLLAARWPRSPLYGVLMAGLAAVSFKLAYRSFTGVCLLSIALWLFMLLVQHSGWPLAPKKLARWLAVGSVFSLLVGVALFSTLALNDVFGDDEKARTEMQVRRGIGLIGNNAVGEYLGLIAGGRSEFIIALRAIADAPVLGHGSWAKNFYYADMWLAMAGEEKMSEIRLEQVDQREPGLIPSHSHILSAWVEGGIAGGIFWGVVLAMIYGALALCLCVPQPLATLLIPTFTLFVWDIFFSPLSTQSRLLSAFYLAAAVVLLERARARQPAHPPGAGMIPQRR
jgi:hypothetical protein